MTNIRYVGAMAKGMAVGPGIKLAVVRGEVYDIPNKVAESFLRTNDWEKASPAKKKKVEKTEEIIEVPIEVEPEENIDRENFEEDE